MKFIWIIALYIAASPYNYWQSSGKGTQKAGGTLSAGNILSAVSPITYDTTLAAETAFNTSACSSPLPAWCTTAFPGWSDAGYMTQANHPSAPIITLNHNPAPFRISKGRGTQYDVHTLTDNATAKHYLHLQFWFNEGGSSTTTRDGTSYPYNGSYGHMKVGHTDDATLYTDAVVNDSWNRGYDGFMGNWSGGQNTCTYPNFNSACSTSKQGRDAAYVKLVASIAALHSTMKFMILVDQTSLNTSDNCTSTAVFSGKTVKGALQPACVQGKMQADLRYAKTAYFALPSYARDANNGNKPFVAYFISESNSTIDFSQCTTTAPCTTLAGGTCTNAGACWNAVWNGVQNYMTTTQGTPISMIFRQSGGWTHVQSAGSFHWDTFDTAEGSSITTATQLVWNRSGTIDSFYSTAKSSYPAKTGFGIVRKGDSQHLASWHYPAGRISSQRCGQTWLDTHAKLNGTAAYIKYIQIATFDDYEEGSAMEMGIDNCYTAPTLSAVGTVMTVTLHPTDTTYAGIAAKNRTIQDYSLFVSVDGTNLFNIATITTTATQTSNSFTFDIATLPQLVIGTPYQFFVRQNGKPSIKQIMSSSLTVTR